MALYKTSKQKRTANAIVANRCHFTFTSKNKCLSDQAPLRMIGAPERRPTARGMAAFALYI